MEAATLYAENILRKLKEVDRALAILQRGKPKNIFSRSKTMMMSPGGSPRSQGNGYPSTPRTPRTPRTPNGKDLASPFKSFKSDASVAFDPVQHAKALQGKVVLTFGEGEVGGLEKLKQALLNTLLLLALQSTRAFLGLHCPIDFSDTGLKSALAAVLNRNVEADTRELSWMDYIPSLFLDQETAVVESFLGGGASGIKYISAVAQCVRNLPLGSEGGELGCIGIGSMWIYVWMLTEVEDSPEEVLASCVRFVRGVAGARATKRKEADLCAGFFLIELILSHAEAPKQLIQEALEVVESYCLNPAPAGTRAMRLFGILQRELSAPGALARKRLLEYVPALRSGDSRVDRNIYVARPVEAAPRPRKSIIGGRLSKTSSSDQFSTEPARRGQCMHILMDNDAPLSENFKSMVQWNARATRKGSIADEDWDMRCALLSSILSETSPAAVELIKASAAKIPDEEFARVYRSALSTVSKAEGLPFHEAEKLKKSKLADLRKLMVSLSETKGKGKDGDSNWKAVKKSVKMDLSHEPSPLPKLPPTVFSLSHTDKTYYSAAAEVLEGALGVTGERTREVPLTSCGEELIKILELYYPTAEEPYAYTVTAEKVKIGVCGGDSMVHNTLLGYIYVLKHRPELVAGLDVCFYLLPTGSHNHLASFIAYHDPWYNAGVMNLTMNDLHVLPHLKPGSQVEMVEDLAARKSRQSVLQTLNSELKKLSIVASNAVHQTELEKYRSRQIAPCQMTTKLTEAYFREAGQTFPIAVFTCEAWAAQGKRTFHYNIPFCCRIEVGISASLADGSRKVNSAEEAGLPQPLAFNPKTSFETAAARYSFNATVTFNQVDLKGDQHHSSTVIAPPNGFTSLVVSNIPRAGDDISVTDPSSEFLDLSVVESDWASKARKKVTCMDDMQAAPCFRTNKLQIESPRKNPFKILLDGELYGPFYRVKAAPCQSLDKKARVSFPVMHYMPIRDPVSPAR